MVLLAPFLQVTLRESKLSFFWRDSEAAVKIAPSPFAEGAHRISYYGVVSVPAAPGSSPRRAAKANSVFKDLKHEPASELETRAEVNALVESAAIAGCLARRFNTARGTNKGAGKVRFLKVQKVEVRS